MSHFQAGAAQVDITPKNSQFLFGYPNVERYSDGVYDPLLCSALYLNDGKTATLFLGNDIIWIQRDMCDRASARIAAQTDVPAANIMITGTHTHSGPIVIEMLANAADSTVPPPDAAYLTQLEDALVEAGVKAARSAKAATLGCAIADGSKLGTNRRDPKGPSIPNMPVLIAKDTAGALIGVMVVCNMHPTVLHEDWLKYSGDFPGLGRLHLQKNVIGQHVPFIYHMGSSGNQSPRHVVKGNTIAEAERLGALLSDAVAAAIKSAKPLSGSSIVCERVPVSFPLRQFPSIADAETKLNAARARFEKLKQDKAPHTAIRTAECDVFGAEETLTLAQNSATGKTQRVADAYNPFNVQLIRIGEWNFIGWPGEVFVEFALEIINKKPNTFIITLANGDVQGYIVTAEAVREGGYEASNALFASPESGDILVNATLKLLK